LKEKISVSVSLKKYKADTIRYAAYSVSGLAYVLLAPGKKGKIEVTFEPKPAASAGESAGLKKRFESELDDEKMRSEIADSNRGIMEFIVLKALCPTATPSPVEDSGLTPRRKRNWTRLSPGLSAR